MVKLLEVKIATIFENTLLPPITDIPDIKHSKNENRYLAYGWTVSEFYVKVWYTHRNNTIRIIGGRKLK
ncbi:MAG: BrnT family toxin [Butyrivibrio sp.]|nr:BrnT family toxin [Butyrivibrio sp.]